jgi:hypothetical protein
MRAAGRASALRGFSCTDCRSVGWNYGADPCNTYIGFGTSNICDIDTFRLQGSQELVMLCQTTDTWVASYNDGSPICSIHSAGTSDVYFCGESEYINIMDGCYE